jgi:hypothetical protein
MTATTRTETRSPIGMAAGIVGMTFLLVGILGFIPGIVSHFSSMEFAGHESNAKLLGLFQVSILHNIVHLLFGVAGLALARTESGARSFLIGGGAIYLVLWIYGLLIEPMADANFVPVNTADDWLHFGLGAGMVLLGFVLGSRRATSSGAPSTA